MHGGAPVWITGSFDAEQNQVYWGVGNPGPDWNNEQRPGDNLYSDSVIALDVDTGELEWYFQFTPNDPYDYDAVQVPVLADLNWNGMPKKVMMWANRNGYFYVLDRTSGECLVAKPYVRVNWSSGLDENCRPIITPQPDGMPTYPGNQGDKLVPAFLQSTYWPLLFQCLGGLRNDLSLRRAGIYPGQGLLGGGFSVLARRRMHRRSALAVPTR